MYPILPMCHTFLTANTHGPFDCTMQSLITTLINPAGHNLFTKHLYIIRFKTSNMEDKEYYVMIEGDCPPGNIQKMSVHVWDSNQSSGFIAHQLNSFIYPYQLSVMSCPASQTSAALCTYRLRYSSS